MGLSEGQLLLDIGRRKLESLTYEFVSNGLNKKPVMLILSEETLAKTVKNHFQHSVVDQNNVSYDDRKVMEIHTELNNEELASARLRLDK